MNTLWKKIISAALSAAIAVSAAAAIGFGSIGTDAATFANINSSNVFVKQNTGVTCTLAANVMLLRRTAMLRGDSDWSSITESACRPTLWVEGVGMRHEYNYRSIYVSYAYVSSPVSELKAALAKHPEGIVVYDYNYPHAILLTDYTDGTFYCADPANNTPSGRMPVSNSLINISAVDTYWYVKSPTVSFTSNYENTVTNSVSGESWITTAPSGLNMRSGAGTGYSIVGGIPYNKTVIITKTVYSGGSEWGYTTYNSKSGWICLDYAKKATVYNSSASSSLVNNSSISKTSSIMPGEEITLKASASGGSGGYSYAYFIKRPNADWSGLKDYSSSSSYSLSLASMGTYEFCIKVKDSKENVEKKYFIVKADVSPLLSKGTISTTSLTLGTKLTINAAASGGHGNYKYAVYYKNPQHDSWITLQDYSSSTQSTLTPVYTGKYEICLKVMDKNGNIAKNYLYVNVNKSTLSNNSYLSSTSINLGQTISINAAASGGKSGYEYSVYYTNPISDTWYCLQDYSSNRTATLKPVNKGAYQICIKVRDSEGIIVKKYINLTVN